MLRKLVLLVTAGFGSSTKPTGNDCVLAGPDYPAASRLRNSEPLGAAIAKFESAIDNVELGLKPNDTAWGVALFSTKQNETLYEKFFTPPIGAGVKKVDSDWIFRIGSIAKVFSVWSFLISVGDGVFNDPITKYIPELAKASVCNGEDDEAVYDDINHVCWDDVTIGELASQAAGIARDVTANELTIGTPPSIIQSFLGLPPLTKKETLVCDVPGSKDCSRKETLHYLLKQHPIYAPQHSPAYSNAAFTLLGYAQEAIMGKPFETTVKSDIIDKLGLKHSSYAKTPEHGGVIPGDNASVVGWDQDLGESAPSGRIYSSTADMVRAAQAIIQSQLLPQAQTQRWFRPHIQTGFLGSAVGAPWEIRYLTQPNQHMVEVYTKQGDVGGYHSALAFSPQHEIGWVVLTAVGQQDSTGAVRDQLFNQFSDTFIPMAEKQARSEAIANFNGTYVDSATNSSAIILVGNDDRPGLGVPSMIARGVEIVGPNSPLIQKYHAEQSGRLYPSNLRTVKRTQDGKGTYASRIGFKASFFAQQKNDELDDPCLMAWTALGAPLYGQVSLDDWLFEMGENGEAEVLDIRMWRLKLKRLH